MGRWGGPKGNLRRISSKAVMVCTVGGSGERSGYRFEDGPSPRKKRSLRQMPLLMSRYCVPKDRAAINVYCST